MLRAFVCHGNVPADPLPSNDRRIHIQTLRLMRGIYEVAVEMVSGTMIHIPNFVKMVQAVKS
jgi:hypothetical protein